MKYLLIVLLLDIHPIARGQRSYAKELDPQAQQIEKNILRVIMSASNYEKHWLLFNLMYERKIWRPFTAVLKLGTCANFTALQKEQDRLSMNAFASAELRYYYNL